MEAESPTSCEEKLVFEAWYKYPDARLLVFAKAPVPGRAKTRLAAKLGARGAARFHALLTQLTLTTVSNAHLTPTQLWCAPSPSHAFFAACRRRYPLSLHTQHGADLGKRMHQALASALRESKVAVLIGTDCPTLSARMLGDAFHALNKGVDVVLGPALDGGYVLIGVRRAVPRMFHGIQWSSSKVMAQTRRRLRQLGLKWIELPVQDDVDRPNDLRRATLRLGNRLNNDDTASEGGLGHNL